MCDSIVLGVVIFFKLCNPHYAIKDHMCVDLVLGVVIFFKLCNPHYAIKDHVHT